MPFLCSVWPQVVVCMAGSSRIGYSPRFRCVSHSQKYSSFHLAFPDPSSFEIPSLRQCQKCQKGVRGAFGTFGTPSVNVFEKHTPPRSYTTGGERSSLTPLRMLSNSESV